MKPIALYHKNVLLCLFYEIVIIGFEELLKKLRVQVVVLHESFFFFLFFNWRLTKSIMIIIR